MDKAFIVALREEVHPHAEIHGHPVIFCGVGKVNAALGVAKAASMGVRTLVNIGSCGSLRHGVGEILRIGRVHQDIDCSPICAYGQTAFEEDGADLLLDGSSDHTCFTTDYFYDHAQAGKYSPHYLAMIDQCSVFDMELYAIAKACRRYGIGLSAYKWVSDDGDFSQWRENCAAASRRVIGMLFP